MHCYKDGYEPRRSHETKAVGNTYRATHANQEEYVSGPTGRRIRQIK
jgi:hypothetical protein